MYEYRFYFTPTQHLAWVTDQTDWLEGIYQDKKTDEFIMLRANEKNQLPYMISLSQVIFVVRLEIKEEIIPENS